MILLDSIYARITNKERLYSKNLTRARKIDITTQYHHLYTGVLMKPSPPPYLTPSPSPVLALYATPSPLSKKGGY